MDEAEENLPGARVKAGSHAEGTTAMTGAAPDKVKHAERCAEVEDDPGEELSEQRGRKWRMPQGCSELRPHQAETGIADEVLTILAEAALENQQIDKAMEAMDKAQNLKKEKDVVVSRGEG